MIISDPQLRVHLIAQHAAGGRKFRLVGIVDVDRPGAYLRGTVLLCARSHACVACREWIAGHPHIELGIVQDLGQPTIKMDDVRTIVEIAAPATTDGLPF